MTKLIRLNDTQIFILNDDVQIKGSRVDAVVALEALGIEPGEISEALVDMETSGNSVAHFGLNGFFLYSEELNAA